MVRSSESNLSHDAKFGLGFIFNDKRFNVATSRAKSLLIVIGNPNVLVLDDTWKRFLRYCQNNNAAVGEKFVIPQAPDVLNGVFVVGASGINYSDFQFDDDYSSDSD